MGEHHWRHPNCGNRVVGHIKAAIEEGFRLVVVVSAIGRRGDPYATDTLLDWIRSNGKGLGPREQDLLLSCGEIISAATLATLLREEGLEPCVLTGGQAGIITNNNHLDAQILRIHPRRVLDELERGNVVIVTGFQGRTAEGEVTTLGRGGSDTTATALGVACLQSG